MAIYLNFGGFLFASVAKTIWFSVGGSGTLSFICDLRQAPPTHPPNLSEPQFPFRYTEMERLSRGCAEMNSTNR